MRTTLVLASLLAGGCCQWTTTHAFTLPVTGSKVRFSAEQERISLVSDASWLHDSAQSRRRMTIRKASDTSATPSGGFDTDAMVKYGIALAVQVGLVFGAFSGLDALVAATKIKSVPFAANCVLFYFLALKSRVLNPLSNARPQKKNLELENQQKRVMPTWTPPGPVFPIVWLLLIGPLRAVTSAMVYQSMGYYACPALTSLVTHLSIGDIWNTINNNERRYGLSVLGVFAVWASKAITAFLYYQVNPLAGKLLSLSLIWLTIASALVTRTWQLNPDPATGTPEPLYPAISEKSKTKFVWFQK